MPENSPALTITAALTALTFPPMTYAGVDAVTLIKQLGDDDFFAREEAHQALAALGASVKEDLLTATKSDDAEVARRAGELLSKVYDGELGQPTLVRLSGPMSAKDGMEALARQVYGRVRFVDASDTLLYVAVHDRPFWPAFMELVRASGNRFDGYDPAGFLVVGRATGKEAEESYAFSGPAMARLSRGRWVPFSRDRGASPEVPSFDSDLAVFAEPSTRVRAYGNYPGFSSARAETGAACEQFRPRGELWLVPGGGFEAPARLLEVWVPDREAKRLASLRVREPLAVERFKKESVLTLEFEFTDVALPAGRPKR